MASLRHEIDAQILQEKQKIEKKKERKKLVAQKSADPAHQRPLP